MEEGLGIDPAEIRGPHPIASQWAATALDADVVVAVPDTSRPAAMAMAEELGVPHREGFIKNRYSGSDVHHARCGLPGSCAAPQADPIRGLH